LKGWAREPVQILDVHSAHGAEEYLISRCSGQIPVLAGVLEVCRVKQVLAKPMRNAIFTELSPDASVEVRRFGGFVMRPCMSPDGRFFRAMSPDEKPGRRIIGTLALGVFVTLASFALDVFFDRRNGTLATNALNDLIIGAAVALLAHIWVSRRDAKYAQELSAERRMQEAINKERKRIALEIHDTVGQAHSGAIMHLELATDSLPLNESAREHVSRAQQLICESITEMRCALWDLYPEELQKLDLKSAIGCLVKDLTTSDGLVVHFNTNGLIRRLPLETERALLRICQEALSNTVKHARAHEVKVDLRFAAHEARLEIEDDGQGFLPEESSESLGLISMKNRAHSMGGVWTIRSEPGSGTSISVLVPISPAMD